VAGAAVVATVAAVTLTAAPAQAVGPVVNFTYIDPSTKLLTTAGDDRSGATAVTPAGVNILDPEFAVSENGDTSVYGLNTTVDAVPQDSTHALVVTRAGVSRVLATYWDAQPVISADGDLVWFLVHGNLYRYSWTNNATSAITSGAQFNPTPVSAPAHAYPFRLSISPDGTRAAVITNIWNPTVSTVGVSGSQIVVRDITKPSVPLLWKSAAYGGVTGPVTAPEVLPYTLAWVGNTKLVHAVCPDNGCLHWTTSVVDVSAAPASTPVTALPALDDYYGLRSAAGTWYAWKDVDAAKTATFVTMADPTDTVTAPTPGSTTWTGISLRQSHIPTTAPSGAFTGLAAKLGVQASLTLSSSLVPTGSRVHYTGAGAFPVPVTVVSLAKEQSVVGVGTLRWSTDAGRTWKVVGPTVYGGGLTPRLTRNTWFQWMYAGDAFTSAAASKVTMVAVSPAITIKVTKAGAKKIVAGATSRVGGTIVLYRSTGKTWKKVVTARISAKGAYSFGRSTLAHGSYKVVTVADRFWASSTRGLKL